MKETIAQKVLRKHLVEGEVAPGSTILVKPDRILLNDASGPITFKQFKKIGAKEVSDPDKVVLVCDHFTPVPSLAGAVGQREMEEFAKQFGIKHFYGIGHGGIEHTLLPQEGLVRPGDLVVGGDSHTCTYGAFDAFGTGMGSTDIASGLALGDFWFMVPQTARFDFKGKRDRFVSGKDLILKIVSEIGVDGATYQAMEFGGAAMPGFNIDERMALCNMAVEAGAKTCFVQPDSVTSEWAHAKFSDDFELVSGDEGADYASEMTFDLSDMTPLVAKPHSPGNVVPLKELIGTKVNQAYIGNCANGTITDLRQAAQVVGNRKVAPHTRALVVPATQQVYLKAMEEGLLGKFVEAGFAVSTPTCGACFGGHTGLLDAGEVAISTTNRNFRGRMGNAGAEIYLANAYVAAAAAVTGEITDPAKLVGGDAS